MEVILFSNGDIKFIKNNHNYYFLFNTLDDGVFLKKNVKANDLKKLKIILSSMDIDDNIQDDYDLNISTK